MFCKSSKMLLPTGASGSNRIPGKQRLTSRIAGILSPAKAHGDGAATFFAVSSAPNPLATRLFCYARSRLVWIEPCRRPMPIFQIQTRTERKESCRASLKALVLFRAPCHSLLYPCSILAPMLLLQ